MIVKAYIYEKSATDTARGYFVGECEAIPMKTNISELKGELVEFYGDSEKVIIQQIIAVLKSRGMTGKLRVM